MKRIEKIETKLLEWKRVFCTGVTCKINMKRDAIIVLMVMILSAAFSRAVYDGKNKTVDVVEPQMIESIIQQADQEQAVSLGQEAAEEQAGSISKQQ